MGSSESSLVLCQIGHRAGESDCESGIALDSDKNHLLWQGYAIMILCPKDFPPVLSIIIPSVEALQNMPLHDLCMHGCFFSVSCCTRQCHVAKGLEYLQCA
jgi:hypothetical protein